MRTPIAAALAFFSLIGSAQAGTVTAVGAVKALTDINQVLGLVGTAGFDEGPTSGNVPANQYSAQGLTWASGNFSSILPGVTTPGFGYPAGYGTYANFPAPIGGGGVQVGQTTGALGNVATFSGSNITQIGLTASNNGNQFLTVWSKSGAILGQVNWAPPGSQFIGIDTLGVPIGMVAYGNDDLWSGAAYDVGGAGIISDTWVWATGKCATNAQCDDKNPCTTDTCTVATGLCVRANNTLSCSDSNACTQNDMCSGGTCVPGAAVMCTALDGCHAAGVCNPMSGVCSTPNKADGSACTDANACTQTDTCQAGVCTGQSPVMCPSPDACHLAGTCDVMSGMCTNPAKPDGVMCDDSNACTQTDTCQAGACVGANAITCPALDACHDVGTCDTVSGVCSTPDKPEGASCDDGTACTQGDTCKSGICTSGALVACQAIDKCHDVGACNMTTGQCTNPLKPLDCSAKSVCEQDGFCNPASGVCINAAKPDGVPCGKGICIAGTCSDEAGNTTSGGTSTTGSASTTSGSASTGAGGAGAGGAGAGGAGVGGGTGVGGSTTSGTSGPGATSTSGGDGSGTSAGGCGCSTPSASPTRASWLLLGLLVPAWRRRRRTRAAAR